MKIFMMISMKVKNYYFKKKLSGFLQNGRQIKEHFKRKTIQPPPIAKIVINGILLILLVFTFLYNSLNIE
ncbi:hypothetical protein CWS01_14700 [Niallia nealsonii]|uniref:Uncharacterized protein n=1 Tax=Niallia nealsonii TaxID=115979 RepID=A0A2N0Z091_9BACI|nr:hypothetical protein CWS01_14700 [Niallia nealsonii]